MSAKKPGMTKQGVKDLNYYGPKKKPPTASSGAEEQTAIAPTVAVAPAEGHTHAAPAAVAVSAG